jgi:tRNA dimethylallyltransferase
MSERKKLIVIAGATAVGKTDVSIQLAQELKTEIISADSRQIFKELTIGTAKPTEAELATVPHHFINYKSIQEDYDAGQYGRDALALINELFKKHNYLILCGGSGLYIKAVCEGFDDMPEISPDVRDSIIKKYNELGLEWLQEQVQEKDPDYFSVVDQKNPHRLVRALELIETTNQPVGFFRKKKKHFHEFDILKFGLELEREELYHRIDTRMDKMIEGGLFEEAKQFYPFKHINALQTVGYKEIFDYFDGKYDREEAIRLLKRNSRRYAKRQMTWFKKDMEMTWVQPSEWRTILNSIR